jgi:S-DNA-T family DNA segregation ATPase FtsK/SpoIIIE
MTRSREHLKEILAWVVTGLMFLLLTSLISYDPKDLSSHHFPPNNPPANRCGRLGAQAADALLVVLGSPALVLLAFSIFWCVRWSLSDHLKGAWTLETPTLLLRLGGAAVLALALSGLEGFFKASLIWGQPILGGGTFGHFLSAPRTGVLRDLLNAWGTFGILGLVAILSFILATNLSVLDLLFPLGLGARNRIVAAIDRRTAAAPPARLPGTPPAPPPQPRAAVTLEPAPARPAPPRFPPEPVKTEEKPRPKPVTLVNDPPKPKPVPRPAMPAPSPDDAPYTLPPITLLDPAVSTGSGPDPLTEERKQVLVKALGEFGIPAIVVNVEEGPVITQYELELAPGIKVGKILSLANDIAMALKSTTVRIVAPLPGKSTVGVEVPKSERGIVRLRELIQGADPKAQALPFYVGRDVAGKPLTADIAEMPHLLVAGTTGSGKTVCLNTLILSLLMTRSPREAEILMVDPKTVELAGYRDIPHLIGPIVTDMKKAAGILDWAVDQMEERYDLLARVGVRHIDQYNALGKAGVRTRMGPEVAENTIRFPMPYTVILIDEYADLMLVAAKEVEAAIQRLVQKSRAVGIHVVLATQRPSVDVITGVIKANVPVRISFQVSAKVDSRTILDASGADLLLGRGDMLYRPPGSGKMLRAQGAFVSDEEVARVVAHVKGQGKPHYREDLLAWKGADGGDSQERDALYRDAVRMVLETGRGSVSMLQRHFEIGYTRAARLIDLMAEDRIVGEYKGSVAREVLISIEEWERGQGGERKAVPGKPVPEREDKPESAGQAEGESS